MGLKVLAIPPLLDITQRFQPSISTPSASSTAAFNITIPKPKPESPADLKCAHRAPAIPKDTAPSQSFANAHPKSLIRRSNSLPRLVSICRNYRSSRTVAPSCLNSEGDTKHGFSQADQEPKLVQPCRMCSEMPESLVYAVSECCLACWPCDDPMR